MPLLMSWTTRAKTALLVCTMLGTPSLASDPLDCSVLFHWPMPAASEVRWAAFAEPDPETFLVDADSLSYLAQRGTLIPIKNPGLPVGWLHGEIVWRDPAGQLTLLRRPSFVDRQEVPLGRVELPWTFGPSHLASLHVRQEPPRRWTFPLAIPGADVGAGGFYRREEDPIKVAENGKSIRWRGDGSRSFGKRIYGHFVSPDTAKVLVYFGDTDWRVVNTITGDERSLPSVVHHWFWMKDSETLLGTVGHRDPSGHEREVDTDLYVFRPIANELQLLVLPEPVDRAVLRVLDVATDGRVLLAATSTVGGEAKDLGLYVVGVNW